MKKILLSSFILLFAMSAKAQYQVANSNFEEWENVTSPEGVAGQEPKGWNGYLSATGMLNARGQINKNVLLEPSTDVRPGSAGQHSALIKARSLMMKNLYGNLTTGCPNVNGVNPADARAYFNYTNPAAEGMSMPFRGRPDSVRVWTKLVAKEGNDGLVSVILHSVGTYKTPIAENDTMLVTAKVVAQGVQTVTATGQWQCNTLPIMYTAGVSGQPSYALVSFQTSNEPGKGDNAAQMYIDDMEFVYNSEIATLRFAGRNIKGMTEVDEEFDETLLNITANGQSATVETEYNEETYLLTITVKGGNYSDDPTNVHTYTIQFAKPEEGGGGEEKDPVFTFPTAGTEREYEDKLKVVVNGVENPAQEYSIGVKYEDGGLISVELNNFVLVSGGDNIPIGNVRLDEIQLEYNKDKKYSEFIKTEDIYITAGDDKNYSFWMGPMLNSMYGAIPVTMKGNIDAENMYVEIAINMMSTSLGQMIFVTFGQEFEGIDVPTTGGGDQPTYKPLPTSGKKVFSDDLYVQVNENITGPLPADVTVTFHKRTIDFALYNFSMELDGDVMYIGNIEVDNLAVTHEGDGLYTYSFHDQMTIEAGDPAISGDWMGPLLGALDLGLDGKITVDQVYVTIDIPLEGLGQNIHVIFGKDEFETGIVAPQVTVTPMATSAIYDLSGRKVKNLSQKGVYIVNGKKIVRK